MKNCQSHTPPGVKTPYTDGACGAAIRDADLADFPCVSPGHSPATEAGSSVLSLDSGESWPRWVNKLHLGQPWHPRGRKQTETGPCPGQQSKPPAPWGFWPGPWLQVQCPEFSKKQGASPNLGCNDTHLSCRLGLFMLVGTELDSAPCSVAACPLRSPATHPGVCGGGVLGVRALAEAPVLGCATSKVAAFLRSRLRTVQTVPG